MESQFQKEFTVSSYELNPMGQARLTTMANYFQEVAYQHANELGFGFEAMKERRTMWLLSRMKIRMEHYPAWGERITIETWPSGIDKIFAIRDFRVLDEAGREIGVASSSWLIVDLESHRPIRPKAELEAYALITYGKPVFDTAPEKIPLSGNMEVVKRHMVLFSDLDIVGHVNNVKYMEWSIDAAMHNGTGIAGSEKQTFSPANPMPGHVIREFREIRELEINFMKETKSGDEVVISAHSTHTTNNSDQTNLTKGPNHTNHTNHTSDPNLSRDPDDPAPSDLLLFVGNRQEDGAEVFRSKIEMGEMRTTGH
ncbi:MAG: acyl-ACP thioesterase domain-containing protein [Bacteroidota bacterium]